MQKKLQRVRIFTVGHSNRSIKEFLSILQSKKLKLLVDVRLIPKSRHNPQFSQSRLKKKLKQNGIEYIHLPGLGGRRRPLKNTLNAGWRSSSFRGYADYMQTTEFKKNLSRLISLSKRKRLVIMCAEAVPWRCHRSLIADALLVKKLKVDDLFSATYFRPHKLTSFALVKRGRITYPVEKLITIKK
jgi:uncharacterized protein (DUF488 family)